jgi:hypothetical protein
MAPRGRNRHDLQREVKSLPACTKAEAAGGSGSHRQVSQGSQEPNRGKSGCRACAYLPGRAIPSR